MPIKNKINELNKWVGNNISIDEKFLSIKKFETVLCESQLYDKKPVNAPKEEKIKIQRRR